MPYKDPNSEAAKANLAKRTKKWRETHPEHWKRLNNRDRRNRWYKCVYGISAVAFETQIAAQNNMCPIGNHPFGKRGRDADSPCQDHDHGTGKNRAILCKNHNSMLGLANDNPEILESAISYLKQY